MASRKFVRSGPKRLTSWFQFSPSSTALGVSTSAVLVSSLNAAALALRPFTIVRSHFVFQLDSDQAAAIEIQAISHGLAIVSDQASAVGITAIPTPTTEAASNLWFMHSYAFVDESNLTDRTRGVTRWSVDSKAMRKVEVGQDMVSVVEGGGIGFGMNILIAGRVLVKHN